MGFSTESISTKQSRRVYVGGDTDRTPLYFVVDSQKVHVTDDNGADQWVIDGKFLGVSTFWTEAGEYESVQKAVVKLDFGTEVVELVLGIATHTAAGVLQSLNIATTTDGIPQWVRIVFKRGDRKKTAVFANVIVSNDGQKWDYISTRGDTVFALAAGESRDAHAIRLLDRLIEITGGEEAFEYAYDEAEEAPVESGALATVAPDFGTIPF